MKTIHVCILAAAIIMAGAVIGYAGQNAPAQVNGCQFNSTPLTLSDGQVSPFQCDSTGNLKTKAQ